MAVPTTRTSVLQLCHGRIRMEQRRRAQEVRHGADILDRVRRRA